LNVDVYVKVMDRFGETHFQGHGHGTIGRLLGDPGESEVERVVASSTKDAVEDTRLQMARMGGGDDAAKNFARYGIPVASGRKSALFLVKADPKGARVSDILFYGTAARGQLQKNDLIVQLDGEELAKHSPDEILALFEHHKGAVYHCTVLEPDGQTVVISFEPQDIRWYQENAPGTGRRR
jgi:C-terminal processing protease CtpA/Prc